MNRAFTNILCDDVNQSALFYEGLLEMTRHADFGWFVILTHEKLSGLEFGLLDRQHETVTSEISTTPGGVILTFVIDDVEACYLRAQKMNAQIIAPPTDMPYGQRRLLVRDPVGTVIDVSAPIT